MFYHSYCLVFLYVVIFRYCWLCIVLFMLVVLFSRVRYLYFYFTVLIICVLCFTMFFFFKQKTAYDMRISDWSSDVCSSDLDRFQEDTRIIVMIGAEAGQMRLDPVPGGHREAADPVALGIDEIGEAHIGPPLALGDLLAQERDADIARAIGGLLGHDDVVDLAPARPQPGDGLGGQPLFGDDAVEHRLRVLPKTARAFTHHRIVEDRGIGADRKSTRLNSSH